jgi:hypothetical protein
VCSSDLAPKHHRTLIMNFEMQIYLMDLWRGIMKIFGEC